MNRDLGVVRPQYNRWTWPFSMMEEGDWFLVDKMDRETERVRNLASVRAAQLGKRFKVEKNPEDHPGFTKVECVPDDYEPVEHRQPVLQYGVARERLRDLYGFNLDELSFKAMEAGEPWVVMAKALDELPKKRLVINSYADWFDIGAELFEDRIRFSAVPKGWKAHVWEARHDWLEEQGRREMVERQDRERRARFRPATEEEKRMLINLAKVKPVKPVSIDDVMD